MSANIITVDFEDLYHCQSSYNFHHPFSQYEEQKRIASSASITLDLLHKQNVKATFFVVGEIAERYPEIIRLISDRGHHIGSHSYEHRLISTMGPEEFRKDLERSINVLETITNKRVNSYRAPAWSVGNRQNAWFWDVLRDCNIKYDSSIFPTKNFLFGEPNAPRFINERPRGIIEIPPSTLRIFRKNIPFSGGIYLRAQPLKTIKWCIRNHNRKGMPIVMYFHPWEIDSNTEKVKELRNVGKYVPYLIMNYNIGKNLKKIEELLMDGRYCSISEYFQDE